MVTHEVRALASRLSDFLQHHAKYCGLELIELKDPVVEKLREEGIFLGETYNCFTFGLRNPEGRVWTVTVADPDDGQEDGQ